MSLVYDACKVYWISSVVEQAHRVPVLNLTSSCPPLTPTHSTSTCSALSFFGLTYDLLRFPNNEIEKGKLQMRQRALNAAKSELYWGPDPDSLPLVTKEKVRGVRSLPFTRASHT